MRHIKYFAILPFFILKVGYCQQKNNPCASLKSDKDLLLILSKKPLVNLNIRDFRLNCNVSDTVKNKLLKLLNPIWDSIDIENYLDNEMKEKESWFEISEKARKLSDNSDSLYKVKRDSLIKYYKTIIRNELKNNNVFQFNNNLLRLVAYLDIKAALPIIEKNNRYYDSTISEFSLAKLGRKDKQKDIFNKMVPNLRLTGDEWFKDFESKFHGLSFIGNQEAIFLISNFLDTTQYFTLTSNGALGKSSYKIIGYLRDIIKNKDFLALTDSIDIDGYCPCSNTLITKIKIWFKLNRGHYIINREYYPY